MKIHIPAIILIAGLFFSITSISRNNRDNISIIKTNDNRSITTWTGSTSASWDEPSNWNNGVPDVNTDVVIPIDCIRYPILNGSLGIDTVSAGIPFTCASMQLDSATSLRIVAASADLVVKGIINCSGWLDISDDIKMYSGGQLNLTGSLALVQNGIYDGYYGELSMHPGSTVNQAAGSLRTETLYIANGAQYNGDDGWLNIYVYGSVPSTQTLEIDDPDSYFHFIYMSFVNAATHNCACDINVFSMTISHDAVFELKSADTITAYSFNCSHETNSTFNLTGGVLNIDTIAAFYSGSTFNMTSGQINCDGYMFFTGTGTTATASGGEIFCKSSFISHNQIFQASGGTVTMYGPLNTNIDGSPVFYNLTVDKEEGYKVDVELDSILVSNNLLIQGGYIDPNGYSVHVGGNWTNLVGDDGFLEGTGKVILSGANKADITTNETFYDLVLDKTASGYDALDFAAGVTITVNDDFTILDGGVEMNANCSLNVGDSLYIGAGAGLNAFGDAGLTIEVGGDWINNNTFYNTAGVGFAPGASQVVFNGNQNANIQYAGNVESFFDVALDKQGDTLFYTDTIAFYGSLNVQNGVLKGNYTPTRLFDDLYVENTGEWRNASLIFNGEADQSVILERFCLLGDIIINKQANVFMPESEGSDKEISGIIFTENAGRDGNRSQSVQFHSDLWISGGGDLVIEEGNLECDDIYLYVDGNIMINNGGILDMAPGGTIKMEKKLKVNNGGQLDIVGTETDRITVTGPQGHYMDGLIVRNGGIISSAYTDFGRITDSAIYIIDGAMIDPANSFNYCSFADFEAGTTFLTINNGQELTIAGLDFNDDPGGGAYNIAKTVNQGMVYLADVSGAFSGPTYENDPYDRIEWAELGTWTGATSSDWMTPSNWTFNVIPGALDDVILPGGCSHYPVIASPLGCNDMEISTGATFTVNEQFDVAGNLAVAGEIILDNNATSVLNIAGDVTWQAGSELTKDWQADIYISGDWIMDSGANLQFNGPGLNFVSTGSQHFICHESNAHLGSIHAYSEDTLFISGLCTDTLRIADLVVRDEATVVVESSYPIIIEYHLANLDAHFYATQGEIIMEGPFNEIDLIEGDYLHDLTINSAGLCNVTSYFMDTLQIKGDLVIGSVANRGTVFDPEDNALVVYGDWTNNAGPAGFDEGTGTVIFKGGSPSVIAEPEIFYNLIVDKTYSQSDGLSAGPVNGQGVDITVLNDLDILDGTFELNAPCELTIDGDLFIALNAGLNANDAAFNILIGGNWINENTTSSITRGFTHNNLGTVYFTGQHTGAQNISQYTGFNDLVINRPGDYIVRPQSIPLLAADIDITSGILRTGGNKIITTGSLNVHDILEMNSSDLDSVLIQEDITWHGGSSANVVTGEIQISGDWYFNDGCDIQLNPGCRVRMNGPNASYFYCLDSASSIGTLILDKDTLFVPWTFVSASSVYDLHISGNLTVMEGNEMRIQGEKLKVDNDCLIDTAALISLTAGNGHIEIDSSLTLLGELFIGDGLVETHGLCFFEESGVLNIAGGKMILEVSGYPSVPFIDMNGTFQQSGGILEVSGKMLRFTPGSKGMISDGTIRMHHAFMATIGSFFQPQGGTIECLGQQAYLVRADPPSWIYNLRICQEPIYWRYMESDLEIKGNLYLDSGQLKANGNDIFLSGSWHNNAGTAAYQASGGKVEFVGTGPSFVWGHNIFHKLIENKTAVTYVSFSDRSVINDSLVIKNEVILIDTLIVNNILDLSRANALLAISGNGSCETEYFDQGGHLNVTGGAFLAYDIVENQGLEGTYLLHSGTISISQFVPGYVDLQANITIHGGSFYVSGGSDRSYWPAIGKTTTLTMDGGLLSFSKGIYLRSGLTANISGGKISTAKSLHCMPVPALFTPTGGIVEMAGSEHSYVELSEGSWFYDLWINKNTSFSVFAESDLNILNELRILKGRFNTNGEIINVGD